MNKRVTLDACKTNADWRSPGLVPIALKPGSEKVSRGAKSLLTAPSKLTEGGSVVYGGCDKAHESASRTATEFIVSIGV
jgi:hypothetical protein